MLTFPLGSHGTGGETVPTGRAGKRRKCMDSQINYGNCHRTESGPPTPNTHTHTRTHACNAHTRTHTRTCMYIHEHARTRVYTHTMDTHTHTRAGTLLVRGRTGRTRDVHLRHVRPQSSPLFSPPSPRPSQREVTFLFSKWPKPHHPRAPVLLSPSHSLLFLASEAWPCSSFCLECSFKAPLSPATSYPAFRAHLKCHCL